MVGMARMDEAIGGKSTKRPKIIFGERNGTRK